MKKLTIALSGLNNVDSPGPGIPVIRGIKDSNSIDARIVGLAYENLEPGAYMHDLVDITYKVPYPSDGVKPLLERLRYIHDKEQVDVLIPNFDSELFTFMKSEKILQKMGIRTFLPTLKQFEERQKPDLSAYGKKYGIKGPLSEAITSIQDFRKIQDKFEFPVFVKGKFYDAYPEYNPVLSSFKITLYFKVKTTVTIIQKLPELLFYDL